MSKIHDLNSYMSIFLFFIITLFLIDDYYMNRNFMRDFWVSVLVIYIVIKCFYFLY